MPRGLLTSFKRIETEAEIVFSASCFCLLTTRKSKFLKKFQKTFQKTLDSHGGCLVRLSHNKTYRTVSKEG